MSHVVAPSVIKRGRVLTFLVRFWEAVRPSAEVAPSGRRLHLPIRDAEDMAAWDEVIRVHHLASFGGADPGTSLLTRALCFERLMRDAHLPDRDPSSPS